MDRRSFVIGGAAAAVPILSPQFAGAACTRSDRLDRIGLQLYTVRHEMANSVERTLHEVARIGYQEVEFAGYFDRPPRAIKQLLDRNGLSSPSAHIGIDAVDAGWFRTLNAAAEMGQKWLVVASLPEEARNSVDALKQTAEKLNRASSDADTFDIRVGYHNHAVEFTDVEGRRIYDVLLEETDPKLVDFEMDLYWITVGGGDPFGYFKKWPGRFPLLHVKDSAGPPKNEMTAVGKGTIDFAAIFRARELAGFKHYFVENDDAADPMTNIRTSYRYLNELEF